MQFVPIIPRPVVELEDHRQVSGIAGVKRTKPVQERTLPPLASYPRESSHDAVETGRREQRYDAEQADRRLFCRRIGHLPVLEELRSAIDRRKRNQRNTDFQLHIDEEV